MKKFYILLVILLFACSSDNNVYNVPLVKLLLAPSDLNGKFVSTKGYLKKIMKGHYYIYPYKEDAFINDLQRAIYIQAGDSEIILNKCKDLYVEITAIYTTYSGKEHSNKLFEISNIKYRDKLNEFDGYSNCNNITNIPTQN